MFKVMTVLGALLMAMLAGLLVFSRTGGVSAPEFIAMLLAAVAGLVGVRALTRRRTDQAA